MLIITKKLSKYGFVCSAAYTSLIAVNYRYLWTTSTFKPKQRSLLPQYKPYNVFKMIDNNIIGH